MAQNDNPRPIETSDSGSIDRKDVLGNSSLHTIDNRSVELLEQILEINKKMLVCLEHIAEEI